MPLGFMPLLEVDGRKLSQSMAVTRFIAKRCGELYIQCTMTRHIMQGLPQTLSHELMLNRVHLA
jgi:glutathione S-transferase